MRCVLGGGIGSGKSTVAARLAELGALVISADRVGHSVLEPHGPAFAEVAARWPAAVDGERIDRGGLGAIVFTDGDQLAELEAITHPAIKDAIATIVAAHPERDVVIEVPVTVALVTGRWTRVFVDASASVRAQRAITRGSDADDVRARMARQADRAEWLAWADRVLGKGATLTELHDAADALWEDLRSG